MADSNHDHDPTPDLDPSIMAAMGFGSFGAQPKKNASSKNTPSGSNNSRKPKRQKPNPAQDQARAQGSGANTTPLSVRRLRTSQESDIRDIDSSLSTTARDGADDDPGYIDSDAERNPMGQDSRSHISLAPSSSLAHPSVNPATHGSRLAHPLPARPPAADSGHDLAGAPMDQARKDTNDKRRPPPTQRLANGDCAYFLPSFVVDDPWEGLVPVRLQEQIR